MHVNRRGLRVIWIAVAIAVVLLTLAGIANVATAQESPTATPTPEESDAIAAVVDDDLRVRSYTTRNDGTMRIVLESDQRQDVVVSEVVDDPGGGSQKFAIRAVEAPSSGTREVTLPASGGATIVTRECRDSGSCVFLPAEGAGGGNLLAGQTSLDMVILAAIVGAALGMLAVLFEAKARILNRKSEVEQVV